MRFTPLRRLTPLKPSPMRRVRSSPRRIAKNSETAGIRAAVVERAQGRCECGCGRRFGSGEGTPEWDHIAGRVRVKQSVSMTWMLRRDDHRERTLNRPSRNHWLTRFKAHAESFGYTAEAAWAQREIDYATAKAALRRAG